MTRLRGTLHVTAWKGRKDDAPPVGRNSNGRTAPDPVTTVSGTKEKPAPGSKTNPQCDMISEGAPVHPSLPVRHLPED